MDMEESPNLVLPMGEMKYPQQGELKPKIISPTFRS
jgi:hypothetical protein